MNKTDLIKNVSTQIDGATQKDVAVIVDTVLETIINTDVRVINTCTVCW